MLGPLIAGGIAAGQGIITSAFNMREAEKNRDFQERMSNTAHQREVADLRAAGLNPILSAKHGGASSPSGATAQATAPDILHSALSAARTEAQIKDINSAAALKDAQKSDILATQAARLDLLINEKLKLITDMGVGNANIGRIIEEVQNIEKQRDLLNLDIKHSALSLEKSKADAQFYKGLGGDVERWINLIPNLPDLIRLRRGSRNRTDHYHYRE